MHHKVRFPVCDSASQFPDLWIAFSGHSPQQGSALETANFKEFEAYSVLSRVSKDHDRLPVLASEGNSAAAFARNCSENSIPYTDGRRPVSDVFEAV
jgi:hypothetical protein